MEMRAEADPYRDAPGLQLFSLGRALLEGDLPSTLAAAAAAGFRNVETLGSLGRPPEALKRLFDRTGLRTSSQHMMPDTLYRVFVTPERRSELKPLWLRCFGEAGLDATMAEAMHQAGVLGQRYIVWQYLWPEQIDGTEKIGGLCRTFDRIGRECRKNGLRFAYHNQSIEFGPARGITAFDRLLAETDPEYVDFELDVDAVVRAGRDPWEFVRANPSRFALFHVRDCVSVGQECQALDSADLCEMLEWAGRARVRGLFIDFERLDHPVQRLTKSFNEIERIQRLCMRARPRISSARSSGIYFKLETSLLK